MGEKYSRPQGRRHFGPAKMDQSISLHTCGLVGRIVSLTGLSRYHSMHSAEVIAEMGDDQ